MNHSHTKRPRWLAAATAGILAVTGATLTALPAQSTRAHVDKTRATLKHAAPAWAGSTPALRAAAPTRALHLRVYLAPRGGEAALDAAVQASSTPGSSAYRHFLTPAQYRARFEPSSKAVSAVSKWLKSAGIRVTGVEGSSRYVSATGSVQAAEEAFGTTVGVFRRNGQRVLAPTTAVSVPSSVAASVLGVSGLDTARHLMKPALADPPPAFVNARPCSHSYGQLRAKKQADGTTPLPKFHGSYRSYAVCGYTPGQLRSAYGIAATKLTGRGVNVGIIDAYGASTIRRDVRLYSQRHGGIGFRPGQYTQQVEKFRHQALCGPSGWAGEETLDVEAVHGMAVNAKVSYYGSASCFNDDILATVAKAVDQNKVSIISNSYGSPDSGETSGSIAAATQVYRQAAMQGISILFSSGDSGDDVASTGIKQTDSSASNPYVTAVGGTSTAIGESGHLRWQTGWGTQKYSLSADGTSWEPIAANPFLYGAGGGYSSLYNRPAYQHGVVPASAPAGRAVPDVALDADPTTGMLIGETQAFPHRVRYGEYRIGGTSLASPLMAGVVAVATQHAGGRLGFLNPAIYARARSHAGTFRDVRSTHHGDANVRPDFVNGINAADGILYSVRTFDHDSSLRTGPGWDDVTGVGSPNAKFLRSFR